MPTSIPTAITLAKEMLSTGIVYIYGLKYEPITPSKIAALASMYPTVYTPSIKAMALRKVGKTGIDCSGFVCWVFSNSGVHNLPRTTAQGIYDQCTPVSASDAKAGDIIFFTGTYNSAGAVSHVGIYCGNGVMIHCGDPISYASINSPYWQSHFYSFGRLN